MAERRQKMKKNMDHRVIYACESDNDHATPCSLFMFETVRGIC